MKKLILLVMIAGAAFAQPKAAPAKAKPVALKRSPLFFKETWKDTPGGEHAIEQASVASPNLELKTYSPSGDLSVTGSSKDESNPVHIWNGECEAGCGATLRDKENYADMTGLAHIRWTHKMSGFHQIRPLLKLADGTFLVGDKADGTYTDWVTTEIAIPDVKWMKLDEKRFVTTGTLVPNPDLSKVDEIGFADLTPGSGHGPGGWADVATIEVFAKPVKR